MKYSTSLASEKFINDELQKTTRVKIPNKTQILHRLSAARYSHFELASNRRPTISGSSEMSPLCSIHMSSEGRKESVVL